jgi:formylmethanofuran--tetrahydromethanopterin N-formyltransferase
MEINGVFIQDTFAEAWDLEVARLALTAISEEVALGAAHQFVGAAGSSELGSRLNAGIERLARPQEMPDGRPGVVIACTMPPAKRGALLEELALRLVLASLVPTVALFDCMLPGTSTAAIDLYGLTLDRWQGYDTEQMVAGRRLCAVPTTTGQFCYERTICLSTEGTDGHVVCYAAGEAAAVLAVQAAREAIAGVDGVCPMGYGLEQIFRELDYVPALRHRIEGSRVPDGVGSILNLLMFGVTAGAMRQGMAVAIQAAARVPGVLQIGAMNFGGAFGRHQYHLRPLAGANITWGG